MFCKRMQWDGQGRDDPDFTHEESGVKGSNPLQGAAHSSDPLIPSVYSHFACGKTARIILRA